MIKKICAVLCFAVLCMALLPVRGMAAPASDWEQRVNDEVSRQLDNLNLNEWGVLWEDEKSQWGITPDVKGFTMQLLRGQAWVSGEGVLGAFSGIFAKGMAGNLGLLAHLLGLCVVFGMLQKSRESLTEKSASSLAETLVYLYAVVVILWSLMGLITGIGRTIDRLLAFSNLIFPLFAALLAACGGLTASGILAPTVSTTLNVLTVVSKGLLLKLPLYGAVLAVVGHLGSENGFKGLLSLIKSGVKWIVGVTLTLLLAMVTLQGSTAAAVDGVSLRTAKFAVDSIVPVAGGMFKDMVDTVIGCSALIKNALGVTGMLTLLMICVGPLVQGLGIYFSLKITAAAAGPLGAKRLGECVDDIASMVSLLMVALLLAGVLVFVMIAVFVMTGNAVLTMG